MKRLRPLSRLESTLERAIEGSVDRVFKPSIQPSEISRKLAREMADRQMVSVRGPIVPNIYQVALHPDDFASFDGSEEAIGQHIEEWLEDEADRLGFVTTGRIDVILSSSDTCRPRTICVQTSHRESEKVRKPSQAATGRTEAFWVQPVRAPISVKVLEVVSGPQSGLAYHLQKVQVSIGRSLENDWVIDSADVSRHHALVECHNGQCKVADLNSLNGTFVNHQRISTWTPFYVGDSVTFGLVEVRLTHDPS